MRVLILILIYVALRFDFLVFVHELVNELGIRVIGCDCGI